MKVYIDMDGTLVEFRHKNSTVIKDWNDKEIFKNKRICIDMINKICSFLSKFEYEELFVITQVPDINFEIHSEYKKTDFNEIRKLFKINNIDVKDLILVNSRGNRDKVDYINESENIKNSILIDDTHLVLKKFEEYGGTAFHMSSFI